MSVAPMQADSSDARKRRRDVLALHRSSSDDGNLSTSPVVTSPVEESCTAAKKQRKAVVSSDDETVSDGAPCARSKKPKPQMKYDPDIPMTKEEATAWRRDQRRKRNRESAAASRQRQRDRIDELELELNHWKALFESVQAEMQALQDPEANLDVSGVETSRPEPLCNFVPHPASPTSTAFLDLAGEEVKIPQVDMQQPKPIKMISRQA